MSQLTTKLNPVEAEMVAFFADASKLLGVPKSVGEIYGLLYASANPLALDELVDRLGISKGSGSQGLKTLRALGAVTETQTQGRKTFFEADVNLKQLVGGFIREQVRPHLQNAQEKIGDIEEVSSEVSDVELSEFYTERIEKLQSWTSRSRKVLPLLQKFLGS